MVANFGNALLLHTAAVLAISGHRWLAALVLTASIAFSYFYARHAGASLSSPLRAPSRWKPATIAILCLLWIGFSLVLIVRSLGGGDGDRKSKGQTQAAREPTSRGIILRPRFDKVKLVPPRPRPINLEERRQALAKKQLIPFRGFYWIYQPPDFMPPPSSPLQIGTPSEFRFRSNDTSPLRLTADERFEIPQSLSGVSALEFEIQTTEEGRPSFAARLILRDMATIPNGVIRVPEQPMKLIDGGYKVRFDLPSGSRISKFDRLTVDFVSEYHRLHVAPRVAILGFRFL